jgi:hypothetical protein
MARERPHAAKGSQRRPGIFLSPRQLRRLLTVGAGQKFTRTRRNINALARQGRKFTVSVAFGAFIIVEGRISVTVTERRRFFAYLVSANRIAIANPNPPSSTFHCRGHMHITPAAAANASAPRCNLIQRLGLKKFHDVRCSHMKIRTKNQRQKAFLIGEKPSATK